MNQRTIGIILILLGIVLLAYVSYERARFDAFIGDYMADQGSCYLDDGTCLHEEQAARPYWAGYAIALALLLFGGYLAFLDRTQQRLAEHQRALAENLAASRKERDRDESFNAYLEAFPSDERQVLRAIRAQPGIKQNTLRLKTGMSKASLSLLLKRLEDEGAVVREKAGKTNKVHLTKF